MTEYINNKPDLDYCLLATDGDCAPGGHGDFPEELGVSGLQDIHCYI